MTTSLTACIVALISFLVGIELTLGVASIIIAEQYGSVSCIGTYSGISFTYGTWLIISGITQIFMVLATILFGGWYLVTKDDVFSVLLVFTVIIGRAFAFSWYICGAILFFQTIDNESCVSDSAPLYQFGLALFILQTIAWAFTCLGGNHHNNSR